MKFTTKVSIKRKGHSANAIVGTSSKNRAEASEALSVHTCTSARLKCSCKGSTTECPDERMSQFIRRRMG